MSFVGVRESMRLYSLDNTTVVDTMRGLYPHFRIIYGPLTEMSTNEIVARIVRHQKRISETKTALEYDPNIALEDWAEWGGWFFFNKVEDALFYKLRFGCE